MNVDPEVEFRPETEIRQEMEIPAELPITCEGGFGPIDHLCPTPLVSM